ncbi:MAG: VanW family protein, partial [Candidatus Yanofskybacteria bacterium]|nr:VanW family protein [Candidatus Yanofskybacteria bacterium]
MQYKLLIPIIVVSFLIGQVSLVTFKKVSEEELKKSYTTRAKSDDKFASILGSLKSEELVLSWGKAQNTRIGISDLVTAYHRNYHKKESLRLNFEKLSDSIKVLAPAINQPPVDAKLEFSQKEGRIKEFSLPQNGRRLNIEKSTAQIARGLAEGKLSVPLVIDEIEPQTTSASIEKLGITTLLGHGESDFKGSSSSRIHNIKTGAAKFYGLLLKPGEEFSFNSTLGEVDGKAGYLHELVVKNGKLIPEFGGGICQVSTTLFRAATAAG